jgi:hypothetical protein
MKNAVVNSQMSISRPFLEPEHTPGRPETDLLGGLPVVVRGADIRNGEQRQPRPAP